MLATRLLIAALMTAGAPDAALAQELDKAPKAESSSFKLGDDERAALLPVQKAIAAKDWNAAQAALSTAVPAAHSPDARYAIGRFQLEIGLGTNNVPMQAQGLDNLLASGRVPAADLPALYRNQAVLANNAGDKRRAESAFAKVVELTPTDTDALVNLAQVKAELKESREAFDLLRRAIELKRVAGAAIDESWYKYALKIAYDGRSDPMLAAALPEMSRQLLADYPTNENWRDALMILREVGGLDAGGKLDVLRLMWVSKAVAGERDWFDLANGLASMGNYTEAKAMLDDATAKRAIDPTKTAFVNLAKLTADRLPAQVDGLARDVAKAMAAPNGALAAKTADVLYGAGEPGKAIPLYRAALRKGGVDAEAVKTHLAMALFASGDEPGAVAQFKLLKGPRKQLGSYWLLRLHKS